MKYILFSGLLIGFIMMSALPAEAQNRFDALRFSTQYPAGDAANVARGGASVADYAGYGSVLLNPATLGLAPSSSFHIGIGLRDVSEDALYLNRNNSYDDSQTAFTNIGFVYRFPTVQGSFVIGGGYNQLADFNRAYRLNAQNPTSSITDFFFDSPFYFDTAFNAFAIETDDFGDFPIFRPFFDEPFRGIRQTATVTERGQLGEFTASLGTEFMENFFVGATIGIPVGSYSYRRDFLERDVDRVFGDLDTQINGEDFTIPAPDNVLLQDRIDADISGFSARLGFIYKPIEFLSVGVSYALPTIYSIDESYSVFIQTTYEAGGTESDRLRGETSYRVKTPSRLAFGVATHQLPVNFNASVERVGNSSIQFRNFGDLGLEVQENEDIREDFRDVFNFRAGVTLDISDVVQPSVGYAFMPAVSRTNSEDLQFVSGGLRLGVNQSLSLNFAVQYLFFNDNQIVYSHYDYNLDDGTFRDVGVRSSVDRFHVMIGANFSF
ncbi:MAG: hypothetical protein LAT67_01010 [Balneolales bacterium]|nr:hypothetical protein [Balneolales bacterium]